MKCSVCGSEIPKNSTRCGVCGTIVDRDAELRRAMSNISSLASALKTKREEMIDKEEPAKFNKVSNKDEEIADLYSKEITFAKEDDSSEDFDLNAFYEKAKEDEKSAKEKERANDFAIPEDWEQNNMVVSGNATIAEEDSASEDVAEVVPEESPEKFELPEDNEPEDKTIVDTSAGVEPDIQGESVEQNDDQDDGFFVPEFENEDTSDEINLDTDVNLGYIKESDIQDDNNTTDNTAEDINVDDLIKPTVEEPKDNMAEDTSSVGTKEQQAEEKPQEESSGVALGAITPEKIEVPKEDEYASVKAEDVPYTNLGESGENKATDTKPIVIDDKDVIGLNANNDNPVAEQEDTKKKKKDKEKYNKFAGVMSIIFVSLAVLATGVVVAQMYLLKDIANPNIVFEYINRFLNVTDNQMYVILGALGAGLLSIIFAICQLIFVKPRKMGRVTLIISFLATVGMAVGYYFIDKLLPLLDFVKGLFG